MMDEIERQKFVNIGPEMVDHPENFHKEPGNGWRELGRQVEIRSKDDVVAHNIASYAYSGVGFPVWVPLDWDEYGHNTGKEDVKAVKVEGKKEIPVRAWRFFENSVEDAKKFIELLRGDGVTDNEDVYTRTARTMNARAEEMMAKYPQYFFTR